MIRHQTPLFVASILMIAGNAIAATISETLATPLIVAQQDTEDGKDPKPDGGTTSEEEEPEC